MAGLEISALTTAGKRGNFYRARCVSVAQLDRVLASGAKGRGFESRRARHKGIKRPGNERFLAFFLLPSGSADRMGETVEMGNSWKKKVQELGRALEEQGNEVLERVSEEALAIGKQAKASLSRARKKTEEILNSAQEIEEIKARLDTIENDQQRLSMLVSELANQVGAILVEIRQRMQAQEEEKTDDGTVGH